VNKNMALFSLFLSLNLPVESCSSCKGLPIISGNQQRFSHAWTYWWVLSATPVAVLTFHLLWSHLSLALLLFHWAEQCSYFQHHTEALPGSAASWKGKHFWYVTILLS
jgi:hypothetical protein